MEQVLMSSATSSESNDKKTPQSWGNSFLKFLGFTKKNKVIQQIKQDNYLEEKDSWR